MDEGPKQGVRVRTLASGEDGDGRGQEKSMLMVRVQGPSPEPRTASILLAGRKRRSLLASPIIQEIKRRQAPLKFVRDGHPTGPKS